MSRVIDFTAERLARLDAHVNPPSGKWEYLMRWCPQWRSLPSELNFQGELGWELCATLPTEAEAPANWLIFKRPIP